MFTSFYTTGMSTNARELQTRFIKMRSKNSRMSKCMAAAAALALLMTMLCATVAVAGVLTENAEVYINGRHMTTQVKYIENNLAVPNDSYYVPLRQIFTALGCTVNYNVSREALPARWQTGGHTPDFPDLADWEIPHITNEATYQIYGATERANSNMPIIEIVTPEGEKYYCQIGSKMYDFAAAPPVILIDSVTYIPLRALAYFLVPEGEDAGNSVLWDNSAHDTYFKGRLLWDKVSYTLTIDTEAAPSTAAGDTLERLYAEEGMRILQRMENRNYLVCVIENLLRQDMVSCLAIDKETGKVGVFGEYDSSNAFNLYLDITAEDVFTLKKGIGTDEQGVIMESVMTVHLPELGYRDVNNLLSRQ